MTRTSRQAGLSVLEVLTLTAPLAILSLVLTSKLSATTEVRMQSLWRSAETAKRAAAENCGGEVVHESTTLPAGSYLYRGSANQLLGPDASSPGGSAAFLCNEPPRHLDENAPGAARGLLLNGTWIDVSTDAGKDALIQARSRLGQSPQLGGNDAQDVKGADAAEIPRPRGVRLWSIVEPAAGYMLMAYRVPAPSEAALTETLERLATAGFASDFSSPSAPSGSPRRLQPMSGRVAGQVRELLVHVQPDDRVLGASLVIYLVRNR